MSIPQLHLMLIHFPIAGSVVTWLLLMLALVLRRPGLRTVALAGIVLTALVALAALLSGDGAEETVEHLPGIREALVDRHEDAAETATVLAVLAGVAALGTLALQRWRPRLARMGVGAVVGLALVSAGSIGWAAHLGGQIRHPELSASGGTLAGGEGGRGEQEERGERER